MNYKQIIVARRDLNMSPGKLAAQVSHASMGSVFQFSDIVVEDNGDILQVFNLSHLPAIDKWLNDGSFTKVVLGVETKEEFRILFNALQEQGMNPVLITDNGKTEFNGVPTETCFGLPPYSSEIIDQFTGHLKLY